MTGPDPVRTPELTAYQSDFVRRFSEELRPGSRHLLIAPAGTGKSFAIAASIAELVRTDRAPRVLVLTHAVLAQQWVFRMDRWAVAAVLVESRALRLLKQALGSETAQWPPGTFVMSIDLASRRDNRDFVASANWNLVVADVDDVRTEHRRDLIEQLTGVAPAPALLVVNCDVEPAEGAGAGVTVLDWRAAVREHRSRGETAAGGSWLRRTTAPYRRSVQEIEIANLVVSCARALDHPRAAALLMCAASSLSGLEETLLGWVESEPKEDGARRLVEDLLERVERVDADSRLDAFIQLCRVLFQRGHCHVVAFCEERATQDYIVAAADGVAPNLFSVFADLNSEARQDALRGFERDRGLLVVTSAALESISLNFVDAAIHFDLPATAAVFAQREGAYCRYGREVICSVYFLRDESAAFPIDEAQYRAFFRADGTNDEHFDIAEEIGRILA